MNQDSGCVVEVKRYVSSDRSTLLSLAPKGKLQVDDHVVKVGLGIYGRVDLSLGYWASVVV